MLNWWLPGCIRGRNVLMLTYTYFMVYYDGVSYASG